MNQKILSGILNSHFTSSLKWNVMTKVSFGNYVVTIYSCINLVHIFLQKGWKMFYLFTDSYTILKRKSNAIFQNIKRYLKIDL